MLVQVVGEAPLRRETRTTEANKQKDFLSTPGSSSQDETDGPVQSQSSKRKRAEQDRTSAKKRKVRSVTGLTIMWYVGSNTVLLLTQWILYNMRVTAVTGYVALVATV